MVNDSFRILFGFSKEKKLVNPKITHQIFPCKVGNKIWVNIGKNLTLHGLVQIGF